MPLQPYNLPRGTRIALCFSALHLLLLRLERMAGARMCEPSLFRDESRQMPNATSARSKEGWPGMSPTK